MKRQLGSRVFWVLNCGLLISLTGCQPTSDLSAFLQDLARQALAAFVL